jgi:aminopeptidase N
MNQLLAFRWILATLLLALSSLTVRGQDQSTTEAPEDPRIDATTGAEKANWPPPTPWDHVHMLLELDFGAFTSPEFSGVQTLTLTPRGRERSELVLNCGPDIKIEKVVIPTDPASPLRKDGKPLPDVELRFEHKDSLLTIALPEAVMLGKQIVIRTTYSCNYAKNRNVGLTWVKPREEATTKTDEFPVAYSQGQAEDNQRWFPCHDFPNERVTTEIIATVPKGFEAVSNGRIVSKKTTGNRTTFHWLQDKHHPYYLVALVVGKYSIINLDSERPDNKPDMSWPRDPKYRLPITAYVPIGKEEECGKALANTTAMIRLFEDLFDIPYPWDNYKQVLVRGFPGGMENTSTTIMGSGFFTGGRDADDLVAHELAHQWFGDLVTCRGWEHIWLNEGWASYAEALWDEYKNGIGSPDDEAYLKKIAGFVSAQRGSNRGSLPRSIPMVSNRYRNADAPFSKPDNPYSKGAIVLHMLRERLGKGAFYKAVHNFLAENRESGLVETDQFQKALETESGLSLDQFFQQWTRRPGFPRLDIKLSFDTASNQLTVEAEQTQIVNGDNPAYVLDIPVKFTFESGEPVMQQIRMNTKSIQSVFTLVGKPKDVVFDPRITNLAVYRVTRNIDDPAEPAKAEPSKEEPKESGK